MCHILIREALENEHESFALDKSAEGSQFFMDVQRNAVEVELIVVRSRRFPSALNPGDN